MKHWHTHCTPDELTELASAKAASIELKRAAKEQQQMIRKIYDRVKQRKSYIAARAGN